MIQIAVRDDVDLRDVIRRSPIADLPKAYDTINNYILRSIEVRYGFIDGIVACVWGLRPPTILSNAAYLWLLTTDIIAEHKFILIRYSRRYIEEALKRFPIIIGDVHIQNEPAKRWIKWLGAEFGPLDRDRLPFVIRAK